MLKPMQGTGNKFLTYSVKGQGLKTKNSGQGLTHLDSSAFELSQPSRMLPVKSDQVTLWSS